MTATAGARTTLMRGGPERGFGIESLVQADDGSLSATAPAGPWLGTGRRSEGEVAALGVLVDDVLGYTVNALSVGWSVSTELSVDVIAPVPLSGTLRCAATVVAHDDAGALVRGEVVDDGGRVVAIATLRGRFVPDAVTPVPDAGVDDSPGPNSFASLDELLAPSVAFTAGPDDQVLRVQVDDRLTNPRGNLHGGMVLCLVERAAAVAMPEPDRTSSVSIQLVRGAPRGSVLSVHARPLHQGRTFGVVSVLVLDQDGRTCFVGTVARH